MSSSQADKPIEKGREGYFNGNDGGDGIGLISDTNNYEQSLLWCPLYFMCDYSEAELVALAEEVFPITTVYLCDFHREQAWDRWVRDHKHGLNQSEAEELLTFFRIISGHLPLMILIQPVLTN